MYILGISAFYHDSAACLIHDGRIVYAAQEERFTRKKHDFGFPQNAISFCLDSAGINSTDLDIVAFYDKPFLKFERILETYLQFSPFGLKSFLKAVPLWIKKKIWIKELIKDSLAYEGKILFPEHHLSHAASAFFPSPFQTAAILTCDGVGEWATTSYGRGDGNRIQLHAEIRFPHSLGLLYSAFTYFTGFKVNSGEYKVMGLAPYGQPKYKDMILSNLIDLKEDGSFRLNMKYFDFCTGLKMTNRRFEKLFDGPARKPESKLTQREMDLARSVQDVTEEVMMRMARHVHKVTGEKKLCLAGGVALNCVSNGKILRDGPFEDIWIQPAAGDAGGAVGAALAVWHQYLDNPRTCTDNSDFQNGSYLGPCFSRDQIHEFLVSRGIPFEELSESDLYPRVADLIARQNVIGWFRGRMEFGPRALGNRSIIGDARSPKMQEIMNLKIKFRESFRPFAPAVLQEYVGDYFTTSHTSPYMLLVSDVREDKRTSGSENEATLQGIEKLKCPRSVIPAVTHVDYSARIQSVDAMTNPGFYRLLKTFNEKYGCPVVINTSFNVRGEPIVCTPQEAYLCFMRTNMDYLVLENFVLAKSSQPALEESVDWKKTYELD